LAGARKLYRSLTIAALFSTVDRALVFSWRVVQPVARWQRFLAGCREILRLD